MNYKIMHISHIAKSFQIKGKESHTEKLTESIESFKFVLHRVLFKERFPFNEI